MHQLSGGTGVASLYGFSLLELVDGFEQYRNSAYELARFGVCHGGRYPLADALDMLGQYDRAAFDVLAAHPELKAEQAAPDGASAAWLQLSINTLGRLHIRPVADPLPVYSENDCWTVLGAVELTEALLERIAALVGAADVDEKRAMGGVFGSARRLHEQGRLVQMLEEVIDHVEHVESVCFYVGDRFYALIDRYVNLVDTKGGQGLLPTLREKPFAQWSSDEVLIVMALHALFVAGNAVKFEEFNGCVLSARTLLARLAILLDQYRDVGCAVAGDLTDDILDSAREIRRLSLEGACKRYLRYRWIYGLTFRKKERIFVPADSTEGADIHVVEFGEPFRRLVSQRDGHEVPEHLFFTQLAGACLARDLAGVPCDAGSEAVTGWVEYLIEHIVASAVNATAADYGMSSSLRDMARLVDYNKETLHATIHSLTPTDFYTCFVSRDLRSKYERKYADLIASSVQKRMMFNRWHFIPGNLARELIDPDRHWYYPPLVPDMAIHSDMHRAAHARAQVKYSIRSPGPDMSRPQLRIAGQSYRGFYDIRVVRMDGEHEFTTEDMMRARRRTLWMEAVFGVLVSYLHSSFAQRFQMRGFEAGRYLDMNSAEAWHAHPQQAAATCHSSIGEATTWLT
jgi:hypothetical protein